jgi:hypothetical protein
MTLSNVQPVYPNGIFPWVDRVDQENIVFAEDVDSLAAEVESIENTIGTTPNIEPKPPQGGQPLVYSSISSRISDAMDNAQLPTVKLSNSSFTCGNNNAGFMLPYFVDFDPFRCYNGTDITVPASGWWIVTSTHTVDWWNDGYWHHYLCFNGFDNILDDDIIDWEFSGNVVPTVSFGDGFDLGFTEFPLVTPRWWQFGKRSRTTRTTWQGLLHAGDRVSTFAENGTSNAAHVARGLSVSAIMIKTVTGNFTSG